MLDRSASVGVGETWSRSWVRRVDAREVGW